jgi:hypothetical protein
MNNVTVISEDVQLLVGSEETQLLVSSEEVQLTISSDGGPQGASGPAGPPKSLTIGYPVAGDNLTLFYTQIDIALTQVAAILRGTSSPSVTYTLKYAANRSSAGTAATALTTVTSLTTASIATLQNMPIPANNFLWLEVSATSGNPTELSITVAV